MGAKQSICMRKEVKEMWDISWREGRDFGGFHRRLNLTVRWVVRT